MAKSRQTEALVRPLDLVRDHMATYTPPPYFPQGSLSPPDKNRYRNFKLALFGFAVLLLLVLGGAIVAIVHLVKWLL